MSKNLETYMLPHILPLVPGAPTELILQKLRDVLIDFCRFTQCWQVQAEPIYRIAGITDYDLEFTLDDDIEESQVRVETILYGGVTEDGALRYPGTTEDYYIVDGDDGPMIRWTREPGESEADPYVITLVLVPRVCITAMPDELFFRWYDVWASGAAHKLSLIRNGPWFSPELSGQYLRDYDRGRSGARIFYGKGQVGAITTAEGSSWL